MAAAYLEQVWQGLRNGPVRLSHKDAIALAGEFYAQGINKWEADPVSPRVWELTREANAAARNGEYGRAPLLIGNDDDRRAASMEERFGSYVDAVLSRRVLVIDGESRSRLLEAIAGASEAAAIRLGRNAQGDYSPDEHAKHYPEWKGDSPAPAKVPAGITMADMVAGWWVEAQARNLTLSTYESYAATAKKLAAFLEHEDAAKVTPDDVVRFKDHRLASINPRNGKLISAVTVKDNDLAGLKALFGWAVENRKLAVNPAAGITIRVPRKARTRGKGFTADEAHALLAAAFRYRSRSEGPKTVAAKRWVPWLCAYTGARLGEMVQLRGQDVRQEAGVWVLHITPEAGTVKDKEARTVVLHPHLLDMGFPAFAQARGNGHLFLKLGEGGDWRGPWRGVKNRVAEFARKLVPDERVAPNHGWRHRFKTVGRSAGIDNALLDHITGHAPASVGNSYGEFEIETQVAAMARFPRYPEG